jgi:hypothetical protein
VNAALVPAAAAPKWVLVLLARLAGSLRRLQWHAHCRPQRQMCRLAGTDGQTGWEPAAAAMARKLQTSTTDGQTGWDRWTDWLGTCGGCTGTRIADLNDKWTEIKGKALPPHERRGTCARTAACDAVPNPPQSSLWTLGFSNAKESSWSAEQITIGIPFYTPSSTRKGTNDRTCWP